MRNAEDVTTDLQTRNRRGILGRILERLGILQNSRLRQELEAMQQRATEAEQRSLIMEQALAAARAATLAQTEQLVRVERQLAEVQSVLEVVRAVAARAEAERLSDLERQDIIDTKAALLTAQKENAALKTQLAQEAIRTDRAVTSAVADALPAAAPILRSPLPAANRDDDRASSAVGLAAGAGTGSRN